MGLSCKKASPWLPTLRNRTEFRGFESHLGQLKNVLSYVVDMHMPVFYTPINTVPTGDRGCVVGCHTYMYTVTYPLYPPLVWQANYLLKDQLDLSLRSLSLSRRAVKKGLHRSATVEGSASNSLQGSVEVHSRQLPAVPTVSGSPPVQYFPPKKSPR